MIVTALLLMASQLLCVLCFCIWLRHFINAKQAEIERRAEAALRAWVEQPDPKTPHKLAQLIGAMGQVVGQSAAQSIMASINSDKSHASRTANAIVEGAQPDVLSLLGGGMKGKGAGLMRLAQLLRPMLAGGVEEGNGHKPSVHDRLSRGGS